MGMSNLLSAHLKLDFFRFLESVTGGDYFSYRRLALRLQHVFRNCHAHRLPNNKLAEVPFSLRAATDLMNPMIQTDRNLQSRQDDC